MKSRVLTTVALTSALSMALAMAALADETKQGNKQSTHSNNMDMSGMEVKCKHMKCMDEEKTTKAAVSEQQTHEAEGVVRKVDKEAGTVTIAHQAVASLGWPAMTMSFKVSDKTLLDRLTAGKTVQFQFAKVGGDSVITAVH